MQPFVSILNIVPASWIIVYAHSVQNIALIKLFGVPSIFVLKFFGELFLLFLASALISFLLKLHKVPEE
jgi:hypothetical protein